MSFKTKALVAALALAAIGSANATLKFGGSTTQGNSSLAFVALNSAGDTSLVVDLGFQMTDLLVGGALRAGETTTASWNLATGAVTLNGNAVAGTFAYTNAATFLTANTGAYNWGVIAADGIGGAVSGTNAATSQNLIFTSTALDFDNSLASGVTNASVSDGAPITTGLFAANNTVTGTSHTAGKFGSSTATAGQAFLGTSMVIDGAGTFGQQMGLNNFLVGITDTAYVMRAQLNAPLPIVSQLGGAADSVGSALDVSQAAQFTFDDATQTLSFSVSTVAAPVPEASTYAMLLAGLGAVGFMARRRKSA